MIRITASINGIFFGALVFGFCSIFIYGYVFPEYASKQSDISAPAIAAFLVLAFVYLLYLAFIKLAKISEGLEGFLALLVSFLGLGLFFLGFTKSNSFSPTLVALIGPASLIICYTLNKLEILQIKSEQLERVLTFTFSLFVSLIVFVLSKLSSI